MNETRIKFLGFYFSSHAPVVSFFRERGRLGDKVSPDRRYIIADYFSERALKNLRAYPAPRMGLTFEHIVTKSLFRTVIEDRVLSGGELVSVDEIATVLDQTWHIAVVTNEEDKELSPSKMMPRNWKDGDDIFARYRIAPDGALRFPLYRALEDADQCRRMLGQN